MQRVARRTPLLLVLLLGCVPPSSGGPTRGPADEPAPRPSPPSTGGGAACLPSALAAGLAATNAVRAEHGLGALVADRRLQAAAERHAADVAARDGLSHDGSDGSTPADRVGDAGYDWRFVAENVSAGRAGAPEVVAGWMASPGHRANLLAPRPRHMGMAYVRRQDSRWTHFWVAVYGDTPGGAQGFEGTC